MCVPSSARSGALSTGLVSIARPGYASVDHIGSLPPGHRLRRYRVRSTALYVPQSEKLERSDSREYIDKSPRTRRRRAHAHAPMYASRPHTRPNRLGAPPTAEIGMSAVLNPDRWLHKLTSLIQCSIHERAELMFLRSVCLSNVWTPTKHRVENLKE
ncbi:hypothetical protein EVAR_37871_1 [Eumeta japonica]|uniref:Uncharacterized protein n=1 Tax=Eumeta variegata TaxID=151549 RepID=A0A4C1X266_EUMVA|nr:hypothetical protein EVAR_37871_1 [Eumeta japonica]